jgi:hypothetical protein
VILGLGIGLLDVLSVTGHWATMSAADRAAFDPVGDPLSGFQFGELALGALGVLAVSTEYGTGMIRTTLTATPRRGLIYAAKTLTSRRSRCSSARPAPSAHSCSASSSCTAST